MAKTGGDVLVEVLQQWGVKYVFGLPGDGINGIMESLRQQCDKIKFIQVRHEEAAAFMACGYAKYTSKLGVCFDLQPIDFAAFANACGGGGFTVEDPAQIGNTLDQALATKGPVIVEAVVDPFEPPMPPEIEAKQALKFAASLARGEPNRMKIATTILEDKVKELV